VFSFLINGGFLRGRKLAKTRKLDYSLPFPIRPLEKDMYALFRTRYLNYEDKPVSPSRLISKPKLNFAGLKTRD
jgi:hypothetical protein